MTEANALDGGVGLLILQAYERAIRGLLRGSLCHDDLTCLPAPGSDRPGIGANVRFLARLVFHASRIRIEPRPRSMHFSSDFSSDPRRCQFEPKLSRLLRMLEAGDPRIEDPGELFRSRRIERLLHERRGIVVRDLAGRPRVFQDYLLYDWDIHHFHIEPNRGRHLLYAIVRPDDVYIVKIGCHGIDFADPDLLRIVHSEWPGLIPTVDHLKPPALTPENIRNLRRNNAAYAADACGKAVMPVTMRATSGMPVHVVQSQDMAMERLAEVVSRLELEDEHVASIGGSVDTFEVEIAVRRHCPFPTKITAIGHLGKIVFQERPASIASS